MTKARIEVDTTGLRQQLAEARALLEQVPESVRGHFAQMLLQSVAVDGLEFDEPAGGVAAGASESLLVYRPRLVGLFERVMSAMRAGQFDLI